jgi:HSP20 family protein
MSTPVMEHFGKMTELIANCSNREHVGKEGQGNPCELPRCNFSPRVIFRFSNILALSLFFLTIFRVHHLHNKANTMKFSIAAAATTLPLVASGYSMMGPFGRPVIITGTGPCGPTGRCAPSNADRAFDDLKREINSSWRRGRGPPRGGGGGMSKQEFARQQEWLNRAFGLAAEAAAAATAGVDIKEGNEALRQQQEWLGRAFGVDFDSSSTPRYQVNDTDESFQVSLDVPGVKQSDIDISVEENILTIKGERNVGIGDVTRKTTFSKSFTLDSTVETDGITAKLNNGVLLVTAPKSVPVPNVKKIAVMQVEEEEDGTDADDDDDQGENETSENAIDATAVSDDNDASDDAEDETKDETA